MRNDLIHSEEDADGRMDRRQSECTFASTQGKYNVTGQDFPGDCVIVFSHWRVKVEQIPPEASADRWAVLHILEVTELNPTTLYRIFYFILISEIGTNPPHQPSTSYSIPTLYGSVVLQQTAQPGAWTASVSVCVCALCRPLFCSSLKHS